MYRDDSQPKVDVHVHAERLIEVRRLLEELSRRETLALSASSERNRFRWASTGPDSGLTEAQEDFVEYWTPELVLAECRAKRELVCALDEWALAAKSEHDQHFAARLLRLMVVGSDIDPVW